LQIRRDADQYVGCARKLLAHLNRSRVAIELDQICTKRAHGLLWRACGEIGPGPGKRLNPRAQPPRQALRRIAEAKTEQPHQPLPAAHSARTSASVSRETCRALAAAQASGAARRASAHTAMARTRGEASVSKTSTAGIRLTSPELPAAIRALRSTRS